MTTIANTPGRYMRVREAAAYLGLSRDAVYRLIASRRLPSSRLGSRLLLDRERIDSLIGSRAVAADEEFTNGDC